jgi:serine/threonine protein phosphatase PrpC
MRWTTATEPARPYHNQDRVEVVPLTYRTVVVVADGAGGVAGGAAAAEFVCEAVAGKCRREVAVDWGACLADVDRRMSAGLAAVVVVEVRNDGSITGAGVGDCEAWIFGKYESRNLSSMMVRKPLMGEGKAVPVGFRGRIGQGTLVAATDGLWKYAARADVARVVNDHPFEELAPLLVDLVRMKNGALQDDVAVAVVRL